MKVEDEVSQSVQSKDQKFVWHAFGSGNERAWMVASADGAYVTDVDGQRYLDAMSGLWCVNIGYGQQRIAGKVYEQMTQLPYYPLSAAHKPATELAEKLNEWLEGDYRIFFANSGSEANETAFKLARQYHQLLGHTQRYKVISRYRGYHGNTLGALSATGQHQRQYGYEPMAPGFLRIHAPDTYRDGAGEDLLIYGERMAKELERAILGEGPETVAAFIMEPIITGGGILVPPANYAPHIQKICRQYGVLLIIDEVICGFGRTGKNFAFQLTGIEPDIVTMAKGITSGYLPLAATAVARRVADVFTHSTSADPRFRHVNTFGGHPVSCAAALENLNLFEEMDLVHHAAVVGRYFMDQLHGLEDLPIVGDVRGLGLLGGIELVEDKKTKVPLPLETVSAIVTNCKRRGVIVGKTVDTVAGLNNVITVVPPLIIGKEEIRVIEAALRASITSVLATTPV